MRSSPSPFPLPRKVFTCRSLKVPLLAGRREQCLSSILGGGRRQVAVGALHSHLDGFTPLLLVMCTPLMSQAIAKHTQGRRGLKIMGPLDAVSVNLLDGGRTIRKQGVARKLPVTADVRCIEVVGDTVWTGDRGGVVTVRKGRTGEPVDTIPPRGGVNVWCLRHVRVQGGDGAPVTGHIWAGMSNGAIIIYNPVSRREVNHFRKHSGGIYQITDHNKRVYSCSNDFEVFEWKASNQQFIRQFSGHKGYVRCILPVAASLLSGSDDSTIRIWDISTGGLAHIVQHHTKGVHAMVNVHNHVWSAGGSTIIVWDLHTLSQVATLKEHCAAVLTLCRVGTRVYSGGADQEIYAWDVATHRAVGKFTDHTGWVYTMCNTAKVVRYFMWSTSVNDGCLQIWHHDEYHPMDAAAKECEGRMLDLLMTNPEGKLAEHLQDFNDSLYERNRSLEYEVATYRARVSILENELRQQNYALEEQMGVQQALSGVLSDVNTGQIPRLEATVRLKDAEMDKYIGEMKVKNEEVASLKSKLNEKDAKIKELERKLVLAEAQKESAVKAHDTHKAAHLKYIECNVDEVLKEGRLREEALRSQSERLREQLAAALNIRRVRLAEEDLEAETARALHAGRPTHSEYAHPKRSSSHPLVISPQRPAPPSGPRDTRSTRKY